MRKTIITCIAHQIKICTKIKSDFIELFNVLEMVIRKLKNLYIPPLFGYLNSSIKSVSGEASNVKVLQLG